MVNTDSVRLPYRHNGAAREELLVLPQVVQELVVLEKELWSSYRQPGQTSPFLLGLQDPWVWEDALTASSRTFKHLPVEEEAPTDSPASDAGGGRVSKLYTIFPFS